MKLKHRNFLLNPIKHLKSVIPTQFLRPISNSREYILPECSCSKDIENSRVETDVISCIVAILILMIWWWSGNSVLFHVLGTQNNRQKFGVCYVLHKCDNHPAGFLIQWNNSQLLHFKEHYIYCSFKLGICKKICLLLKRNLYV